MDQEDKETSLGRLNADEESLILNYRRCSPRRQSAVLRFTRKLADLEWPSLVKITTNIVQFRRRKDN